MLVLLVPLVRVDTVSSSTEVAADVEGGGASESSSSGSVCSESSSSCSLDSVSTGRVGWVSAAGVLALLEVVFFFLFFRFFLDFDSAGLTLAVAGRKVRPMYLTRLYFPSYVRDGQC